MLWGQHWWQECVVTATVVGYMSPPQRAFRRAPGLLGRGPWQSAEDACGGFPVAVEVTWVNGGGLHKWPLLPARFVVLQEGTQPVGVRRQSCPGAAIACARLLAAERVVQALGLSSQTHWTGVRRCSSGLQASWEGTLQWSQPNPGVAVSLRERSD